MNPMQRLSGIIFLLVAAAVSLPAQSPSGPALTPFQALILRDVNRHPLLQVEDLYKFVFQAAMGNDHLMADTSTMYEFLRMELAAIEADSTETRTEVLTPDSSLLRLNLRPFKADRGDADQLARAMLATAHRFRPSSAQLRQWWTELELLARDHRIPFSNEALHSYYLKMSAAGFPAVHHSERYTRSYRPAYRVVARDYIPGRRL